MNLSTSEIYGLIGSGFSLIAAIDYSISVLRNKTKPHAFSWGIWCLILGIVAVAQWRQGAGPGFWPTMATALFDTVIFALSLFKGEKNITRSDWIALIVALAIIPVWQATDNRLLAVALATLIDACAYFSTMRKSWHKPFEEKISMYALNNGCFLLAIMASSDLSTTTLLYPIFCLIVNSYLCLMLYFRRRTVHSKKIDILI